MVAGTVDVFDASKAIGPTTPNFRVFMGGIDRKSVV